jgi:ABC-type polysaccharide/polyol phosphate export permease
VYILRVLTRNFIIFGHNLLAVIPILLYFGFHHTFLHLLEFIYGLLMLFGFGYTFGMIFAILGTRFIDIKQIVVSFIQIAFMLTPIMWMPVMLPDRFGYIAEYNPFYQIVNLVRDPLTGHDLSAFTFSYTLLLLGAGFACMFLLLRRSRHRIAFWV